MNIVEPRISQGSFKSFPMHLSNSVLLILPLSKILQKPYQEVEKQWRAAKVLSKSTKTTGKDYLKTIRLMMGLLNLPQTKIDKVPDAISGDMVKVFGVTGTVAEVESTHLSLKVGDKEVVFPFILFFL